MTRAASGAKRSGAAAHDLPRLRVIMPSHHLYFAFSFFVPRTPARWEQGRIGLWSGPPVIAGSVVLHGAGGRTANRLKSLGSTVLFYSPSRDARTDMRGYTRIETIQNHRTTEPREKTKVSLGIGGSALVLLRFCSATEDKQWGGYSLLALAGSSRPDQGLDSGAGRRNFSAWTRPAGGAGASIGAIGVARGNGGFQPFSGVPIGPVGTAMSERRAGMADFRRFPGVCRQPARLAELDQAPRGGDAGRRGGTPPSAARLTPITLAQPIFRVSSDLRIRWSTRPVGARGQWTQVKMGSGVRNLSPRDHVRGAKAASVRTIGRVGVMGTFRTWGREPERSTLWGGLASVN